MPAPSSAMYPWSRAAKTTCRGGPPPRFSLGSVRGGGVRAPRGAASRLPAGVEAPRGLRRGVESVVCRLGPTWACQSRRRHGDVALERGRADPGPRGPTPVAPRCLVADQLDRRGRRMFRVLCCGHPPGGAGERAWAAAALVNRGIPRTRLRTAAGVSVPRSGGRRSPPRRVIRTESRSSTPDYFSILFVSAEECKINRPKWITFRATDWSGFRAA
jgi:hypothetical protein